MAKFALFVVLLGITGSAFAQWNLNKIDLKDYPMAQCLDGSAGAYYLSPGSGDGVDKWEIHLQGGGWCTTDEDCLARSKGVNPYGPSSLGGSEAWGATGCPNAASPVCNADGGAGGMLSNDAAVNPFSHNWNKVFIGYCDGGSFAGTVTEPVVVKDSEGVKSMIYYRGRYILDAVFDTLATTGRLSDASDIILKGSSSGGLATYLHADYLSAKIKNINRMTRVSAVPGAGMFVDVVSAKGNDIGQPLFKWLFHRMNMTGSVNAECLITYVEAPWRCIYAPDNLPFIHTPLFISNSLADAAQASTFMELECDPTEAKSCTPAQITYLNNWHNEMIDKVAGVIYSEFNGAFLPECFMHLSQDIDSAWNGILVGGQTQVETFTTWYNKDSSKQQVVFDAGLFGTNPSCNLYNKANDQTARLM